MKQTALLAITEMKELSFALYRNNKSRTSMDRLTDCFLGRYLLSGFFCILFAYFGFSLCFAPALFAKPVFRFQNYSTLKSREKFLIYQIRAPEKPIGNGSVYTINTKKLYFSFRVELPLYRISASVRLRFLGKDGKGNYKVQLDYAGLNNGIPRSASEKVLVDSFLADHGILSLKFLQGKHFLQLSVNSQGQNRLVTEWGSVELRSE